LIRRVAEDGGKEQRFLFHRGIKERQFFKARNVYSFFESSRAEEVLLPQGQIPH